MGFCPRCRRSDPLVEPDVTRPAVVKAGLQSGSGASRTETGIAEVDRVLGGGMVTGSVILVGGEPGVGKSTLLDQVAAKVASAGSRVLLASAEESVGQVGLRQRRLGVDGCGVDLLSSSDIDLVVDEALDYDVLIIDSIQTVAAGGVSGSPGSVAQVRACAERAVRAAKQTGLTVILVGHITKEGSLAGPKTLEHVVDVVLYVESDQGLDLRILRSMKNRFGGVWATGVFEMTERGLVEVPDPSRVTLDRRNGNLPGSVIMPAIMGRRCVLNEVQALVVPCHDQMAPRRSTTGASAERVHQILAVLDRRGGLSLSRSEVYVSVMGGIRVQDPATDLAIAAAIVSSRLTAALPRIAAFGEVGLTGEVRPAPQADTRVAECHRLGIETVLANPTIRDVAGLIQAITGLTDHENEVSPVPRDREVDGISSLDARAPVRILG